MDWFTVARLNVNAFRPCAKSPSWHPAASIAGDGTIKELVDAKASTPAQSPSTFGSYDGSVQKVLGEEELEKQKDRAGIRGLK
jgi:hypothetical protein